MVRPAAFWRYAFVLQPFDPFVMQLETFILIRLRRYDQFVFGGDHPLRVMFILSTVLVYDAVINTFFVYFMQRFF